VKAWVDHIVALGVSVDVDTQGPLVTGKEFIVLEARGGGYGPGTPREGWDHAETWLPHAVSLTGLTPNSSSPNSPTPRPCPPWPNSSR
jgi:FMN-dependent NADH-azoreductase